MKSTIRIFVILSLMQSFSCSVSRTDQYPYGQQSRYNDMYYADYSVFYDHLSPFGYWIEYPAYGYVWIPEAGRNFFPYVTDGRWIFTEFGWTWVSDYEWGWAPFHYGRWDYDNYYGWFWVPDNEWGPAWVIWRRANGYFGWSPMQPGMTSGNGLTGSRHRDIDRWSFVHEKDFGRDDIERRYINRRNNDEIFRNSTVINNSYIDNRRNTTYISGPRPEDVSRVTGRRITAVEINDTGKPGSGLSSSGLRIYRPVVSNDNNRRIAPPELTDPGDIRSGEERRSASMRRGDSQGSRAQGSRRQPEDQQAKPPEQPGTRRRQTESRRPADPQSESSGRESEQSQRKTRGSAPPVRNPGEENESEPGNDQGTGRRR